MLLRAERAGPQVYLHAALAGQAPDGEGDAQFVHPVPQLVRSNTGSAAARPQLHASRARSVNSPRMLYGGIQNSMADPLDKLVLPLRDFAIVPAVHQAAHHRFQCAPPRCLFPSSGGYPESPQVLLTTIHPPANALRRPILRTHLGYHTPRHWRRDLGSDRSPATPEQIEHADKLDPRIKESPMQGILDLAEMAPCHQFAEQALNILRYLARKWNLDVDVDQGKPPPK